MFLSFWVEKNFGYNQMTHHNYWLGNAIIIKAGYVITLNCINESLLNTGDQLKHKHGHFSHFPVTFAVLSSCLI